MAPGVPPAGPDFVNLATDLAEADNRSNVAGYLFTLHNLALTQDWFTLEVKVKSRPRLVRFVPSHRWGVPEILGPRPTRVMLIGKMPSTDAYREKHNFTGNPAKILMQSFIRAGCNTYGDFYITHVLKFPHPAPQVSVAPSAEWLKDCRPLLHMELRAVRPDYILCLGSESSKAILSLTGSLTNSSGKVFDYKIPLHNLDEEPRYHDCKVMTCIHPGAVARTPDLLPQLDSTVRMFTNLINGAEVGNEEKDLNHVVVSTYPEAVAELNKIAKETATGGVIAIDCEWEGEYPDEPGSWLRTIQLSHKPKYALCLVMRHCGGAPALSEYEYLPAQLTDLLTSTAKRHVRLVGHFHRADLPWLIHYGVDVRKGFEVTDSETAWLDTKHIGGFDTGMAAHAVCETDDYKLEVLATRYTTAPRYDIALQKAKKELCSLLKIGADNLTGYGHIPDGVLYPYACLHGWSRVQLADGTWRAIKDLVRTRYSGCVKALVNNQVVDARVVDWHRLACNQKQWFMLHTPGDKFGRHGLMGPIFTPDHKILTQRGKVRIDELIVGEDAIATDEREFTAEQLSVFLGCLLGDGGFMRKNTDGVGFGFSQCPRRATYADWKAHAVFSTHKPILRSRNNHQRYEILFGRYFSYLSRKFPTHTVKEHANRKVIITKELLDNLGILGLAIWYQDDGTLVRSKIETHVNSRIYCVITQEEQQLIITWLTDLLGDGVSYNSNNRFIQITRRAFIRFHELINEFMHPCMAYKTLLPVTKEYSPPINGPVFYAPIYAVIPWVKLLVGRGHGVRYCLTVEGAHNFLTRSGFVSNCYDADVTRRLYDVYNGLGDRSGLLDIDNYKNNSRMAFWISMRASPACLEMELTGLQVDMIRAEALLNTYRIAQQRRLAELRTLIKWPEFNPKSPFDCRELLYGVKYRGQVDKTTGLYKRNSPEDALLCYLQPVKATGKQNKKSWADLAANDDASMYSPATDRETLGILFHSNAIELVRTVVGSLRDLKFINQLLQTTLKPPRQKDGQDEVAEDGTHIYEKGLLSYLCCDRRIRTHIFQTLETGRSASARPNLMNISKRRESDYKRMLKEQYLYPLRSIFVAAPGHVLIEADYVGAELAGMAWMSGDPSMIEHVRRAQLVENHPDYYDIHSAVAVAAFRLQCAPTKAGLESINMSHLRVAAKNVVFGYAYGRGAEAIARQAKEEGVDITIAEAEVLIDGLVSKYPYLPIYFNQCRARTHEPGWICNSFGRFRRFSATTDRQVAGEQERQGMNFPIQSLVADAMSRALDHLYSRRDSYGLHYKIALQIHDAVLLEVPIGELAIVYDKVLSECMTDLVPIYACNMNGEIHPGRGPYNLGIEKDIYVKWGEKLKDPAEAQRLGIPQRFVKK